MIIGIIYHESSKKWLPHLVKSLKGKGIKHQIVIVYNNKSYSDETYPFVTLYNQNGGYELGALKKLMDSYPNENDFFLMHSTVVIKDSEIFDIAAQFDGTLAMSNGLMAYMGKYRREVINKIGIPIPQTKEAAIYWEYFWNVVYFQHEDKIAVCHDPLKSTGKYEVKYGRKNLVEECKYMKKWKSNYTALDLKIPAPESFIP